MATRKTKRNFRLTDGDIEILTYIYQLRLARNDHLIALTGRIQRRLNTRLEKLTREKYLKRRRNSIHERYIYALNKKAAPLLVERGVAPKEIIDLRVRLGELKELFLKHALMVSDIHATLILASRCSPIKLVDWREGKTDVYDSVTVYEDGKRVKYPVRPDAFFTLQDTRRPKGENLSDFFLEADRSTTTNKRFQRKIKGYWQYYEQGLHTKKYGIGTFRVITMTLTEARAVNLCAASREVLPTSADEQKSYYFASVKHFSFDAPEHIHDNIFIAPRDFETDGRYSLIPPLAKEGRVV